MRGRTRTFFGPSSVFVLYEHVARALFFSLSLGVFLFFSFGLIGLLWYTQTESNVLVPYQYQRAFQADLLRSVQGSHGQTVVLGEHGDSIGELGRGRGKDGEN